MQQAAWAHQGWRGIGTEHPRKSWWTVLGKANLQSQTKPREGSRNHDDDIARNNYEIKM